MEDLRIYDYNFNLLHIQHQFRSINWTIYYNKAGTFEARFPAEQRCAPVLFNQDYLVLVQGNKQAICTGKQIQDGEIALYGKTVNFILSRRVALPFKTSENEGRTTPEALVRRLLTDIFMTQRRVSTSSGISQVVPAFPGFVLGSALGGTQPTDYYWRNTAKPVGDVVCELLEKIGAGHRVVYDVKNRQWRFEVYRGRENNPMILSRGAHNIQSLSYTEDNQNYALTGWYEHREESGGQTESTWYYQAPEGVPQEGWRVWEAPLSGSSPSEAKTSLQGKKWERKSMCSTYSLIWGLDYQLGDKLRVDLVEPGVQKNILQRVTGVTLWYEDNDVGQEPILEEA